MRCEEHIRLDMIEKVMRLLLAIINNGGCSMRTRTLIFMVLAVLVVVTVGASMVRLFWHGSNPTTKAEALPDALIVYCFHPAERCPNCEKIESYTREVLDKSFADPLKKGQLVCRVASYESPENAHFANEYKILSSCVVLVDARSGHSGAWKNLQQQAWELVGDKKAFQDFVRGEIQEALK